MRLPILLGLLSLGNFSFCQDPEFPRKEFIMHAKLHSGVVTNFKGNIPDTYVGGIELTPQYTLAENLLRGGLVLDGYYSGKKLQASIGPTLSFKLTSIQLKKFGSGGNIHVSFDHRWGTGGQRLLGGGLHVDLLNFIVAGVSVHRDYRLNSWLLQSGFGIRLSKVKQPPHP